MNSSNHNPLLEKAGASDFEETLRLIAKLPAPEGLEERVKAGVHARQLSLPRSARILDFPALRPGSNWMRSAAAAAIVFVVVGGGWGVYSRVQQPQAAKVIVMPPRVAAPGSFSNAGAMRTPTTLNAPVVVLPVTPKQTEAKAPVQTAKKMNRRAKIGASKAAAQPATAK
ncbi:MAG: hypothetical protein ABSD67_04945 [Terracidiphilus sp.]|jgi:hypothetical protein